jgi:O-antigen ligase
MRKIAFWLSLLLIFIIPWEDSFSLVEIGSLARLIGLIVAGFWLVTILIEGRFRKPNIFHAFVLLFFLWNTLSYLWSIDISRTMDRITTYAQIFILMIILWDLYQKPADLIAGLQAYILGAYVSITSTMINYFNGIIAVNYEVRYSATGVNAVDLSLLLLLGLPLAWHLFVRPDRKKNTILKIVNICYIPIAIFTIFLTGSRTSLFAIVPAAIYILWPKRASFGRFVSAIIVLIVSIFFFRSILPSSVIERLSTAANSAQYADLSGRVTLWRETIDVFSEHSFIGSGSGTLFTPVGIGADSHNTFLSVLAETGVVGFLLFIIILALVVNQTIRLPSGYYGLWLATLSVWAIGVLSLTWEFRKPTWIFLNFVIIEGSSIYKELQSQEDKSLISETEDGQSPAHVTELEV